jgi:hypothetical protein
MNIVLLALLVAPPQQPSHPTRWKCTPRETQECSLQGCVRDTPKGWIVVDSAKKTYSQCDAARCSDYGAEVSDDGVFTIYEVRGRATFLKTSTFRRFIHVTTIGVSALVSSGICEAQE